MTTDPGKTVRLLAERLGAEVVETHISWVLLAGDHAYKLKKPLRLPFVDYSTRALRRHFCEEEVRLNHRLAPSLYLGVSRVTGTPDAPAIDGPGPVLDYAVRMRRFPAGALFSERARAGTLEPALVDRLAQRLAGFHLAAAPCTKAAPGGARLSARAMAALEGSVAVLAPDETRRLRAWIAAQAEGIDPLWACRRAAGHAREGHGDLHLANILALAGDVAAFDCIEFNASLRCIDVIEEVAFAVMDFGACGQPGLGWRFLAAWLEHTGEYEGLAGLRLCVVYRALVRALVEHLRDAAGAAARVYADQALRWAAGPKPRLVVTHGLPGSGKTFVSQQWLEREGAIRIRSDVERKRLHGLDALADSRGHGVAIYTPEATERTYGRLFSLASSVLAAGLPVVLDAAFLRADERARARAVAQAAGVPFGILHCDAPFEVLCERLRARRGDASEADVRVLEALRGAAEGLTEEELGLVVPVPPACPGLSPS